MRGEDELRRGYARTIRALAAEGGPVPADAGLDEALACEEGLERRFRMQLYHVRHVRGEIAGGVFVDAGCGGADLSLLLALMGARRVHAVDFSRECVAYAERLARAGGVSEIIAPAYGDISQFELPPASVDGIFSIEAISHYRDVPGFLARMREMLRPGGFLFLSDDNNAASPRLRARTMRLWEVFEREPAEGEYLGRHKGPRCYRTMRRDAIAEAHPGLDEDTLTRYADWTFGYSYDETLQAVEGFLAGDLSRKSEYDATVCPKDPESDCYMERLHDPRRLARDMEGLGFRCRVLSIPPRKRELAWLAPLWEALTPLTIHAPRGFSIVARRT